MEIKHTPGPWSAGGGTGLLNQVAIEPAIGCAYGDGDEVKANARLIAAAPELLAALQELADCGGEAWGEDRPCVNEARAAIAKATGSAA